MSHDMIESNQGQGLAVSSAGTEMVTSRVGAEVQAAMVVARKFPRDEQAARKRIRTACCRLALAEDAIYEFPRGNQKITGPSIRLMEVMAQNWGNLDFGWNEVERRPGSSTVVAYCWDLQTNVRSSKMFDVPHKRDTKGGSYGLTDDRDIYERVANDASRRVRSCVEAVIPGDAIEEAVAVCHQTLIGKSEEPFPDRIRKMIDQFEKVGVTVPMIVAKLQHPVDVITPHELARLGRVFVSIRDKIGKPEDFFDVVSASPGTTAPKTLADVGVPPSTTEPKAEPKAEPKGKGKSEHPKGNATSPTTSTTSTTPPPSSSRWGDFLTAIKSAKTARDVEGIPIPQGLSQEQHDRAETLIAQRIDELSGPEA